MGNGQRMSRGKPGNWITEAAEEKVTRSDPAEL